MMQDQRARRFPAATALRGNIGGPTLMENQTAWAIPRRLVHAAEPAASLTGLT
jgi:hypothetical protein